MPRLPKPSAAPALVAALILAAQFTACGGDDGGGTPATAVPGTAVVFDLAADLASEEQFFDLPYPSDLRLDDQGRPWVEGWPVVADVAVAPLRQAALLRRGFPVTPAGYFRFDAPLAPRGEDDWLPADLGSPVLLIDIDPGSPERGRLLPAVAATLPADAYTPSNLLAVAGAPGIILEPERTYAFVVSRSLGDAAGSPLGVPLEMVQLRTGETPAGQHGAAAALLYRPLWETLETIGLPAGEVAAATVFTTGDVVADLAAVSDTLVARHPARIEDLAVDAGDGLEHARFCELHGRIRLPQFQGGVPPFDTGGIIALGADGLPAVQREEDAPVAITIPRLPMPAEGYPLVLYFHGTGGLATQVVDRGPVTVPRGTPAAGEGPAHVVAAHGFAAASSASPLNPQRPPFLGGRTYLNLFNLAAYPSTFQQGTFEQRMFLAALSDLEIDPELLAGCTGAELPEGASAFRIDTRRTFVLGQSLGGQFVNMVGAVEPLVAAAVPAGSGGHWSRVVLDGQIAPGANNQILIGLLLGTSVRLSYLHPALQLVQLAFEPAEPIAFAPRLARNPLPGHRARSIYQPLGLDDPGFPNWLYDAMALASGTEQAGEVLWPGLQASLALDGRGGILEYPVADNQRSLAGEAYTGVAVQYAEDGLLDSHHIFAQLDAVKFQYGCFFASLRDSGTAVVPAPAPLGSPCP